MSISMRFEMDDAETILRRRNLENGGKAQQIVDSEVLRLSSPYVPKLSGTLDNSGTRHTIIGSGEVVYNTPYARYQYYGKVMVGSPPKKVTDIDLNYHGGGLRGKLWFERMKVDHKDEILKKAAEIAGGKAE